MAISNLKYLIHDKINSVGKKYLATGILLSTTILKEYKPHGVAKIYYSTGETKEQAFL